MENIDKYEAAIKAYVAGSPIMEDWEFDALENQLNLDGYDTLSIRRDIEGWKDDHRRAPMTTLAKWSMKDILKFIQKHDCHAEPKFDGVAVELLYDANGLASAYGRSGTDFTHVVKHIIPDNLKDMSQPVYGEVVIPKSTPLPAKYKNRRNAVAGILNSNDPAFEDISLLTIVPYAEATEHGLQSIGHRYDVASETDIYEAKAYYDKTVDFETDGIVIKVTDTHKRTGFDFNGTHGWQFCFKFDDEKHVSTVTSIDWQVSPNGKVTPVANFEPVEDELGTMTRASIASLARLEELQIGVGSAVQIKRANKVIPYIENSTPVQTIIPDIIEGKKTFRKGAHLFIDKRMYDDPFSVIRHQVNTLGAKNIVRSKIQKAVDLGSKDIFDFYHYLLSTGDYKNADKFTGLYKGRTVGEWLMFLNLPGVGWATVKQVNEVYDSFDTLANVYTAKALAASHPSLINRHAFSPSIEKTLTENYDILGEFARKLNDFFSEKDKDEPLPF